MFCMSSCRAANHSAGATCDPGGEFDRMHNNWPNQLCWSSINHADDVHVLSLCMVYRLGQYTENNWLDLGLSYQYSKRPRVLKTCSWLTVWLNLVIVHIALMQKVHGSKFCLDCTFPLTSLPWTWLLHTCAFTLKDDCLPLRGDIAGKSNRDSACFVTFKSPWRISHQENHGFSIYAHPSNWSALLYSRPPSLMDSFTGSYVFLILAVKWHYWP